TKKALTDQDSEIDYMFLVAAGRYGGDEHFDRIALRVGSSLVISSLTITDHSWHHISVALDPAADIVRFTLDDQVDTQSSTASGVLNDGPLIIGAHFNRDGTVDRSFDGLIDEISITDGFLALSEIQPLASVEPLSDFAITDFQLDPDNLTLTLTFHSDETRLYHVERTTTLQETSWIPAAEFIPGSPGATSTTVDQLPRGETLNTEFFRVKTAN
ncbi:MAG: LamG-like jellyroll fold domain-containing protein, partial [Verrucomicrobiales bacterium]